MEINRQLIAINEGLREGRYHNEAAISQGIVLTILHTLDWPVFNTQIVALNIHLKVDELIMHFAILLIALLFLLK